MNINNIKICVICSAGGHLQELLEVIPKDLSNIYLVTFYNDSIKENSFHFNKIYFVKDASKKGLNFVLCFIKSFFIFIFENPKIIISSGAGVCIPTIIFSWLFKRDILFLELSCQITKPSKTGSFSYKIASRFYIQHPTLLPFYPKAILFKRYDAY